MTYGLAVPASSPDRPSISFQARVIRGAGRGRALGIPTLNLDLRDVPPELNEGIHACFVMLHEKKLQGAMHYGPRPVFKDSVACEIHLLDEMLSETPADVGVQVCGRVREVRDFPSPEAMLEEIQDDITAVRSILASC